MNQITFGIQLQQLVDGELDHAERSRFLIRADNDAKAWRMIALAFVERQVLDEAFNRSPVCSGQLEIAPIPKLDASQTGGAISDSTVGLGMVPPRRKSLDPRNLRPVWWVAMSACLFIGLVLGNWSGRSSSSALSSTENSTAKTIVAEPGVTHADLTRTIPLNEALERSPVPFPVVFRRELMKQGYLVNELARLTKVQLPNGETIEMPIRQVDVRFLGNATFQ
jgi:hypothetical protein